ncbi:MAG: DUF1786 family protein [Anaerolineae bacterium]|nr:DUF1786 family protein [Anaerolineae bacterium]
MGADRILAIDVGGGTQDILIYDPAQPAENALQLVLPAPTVLVAGRIRRATAAGRPIFLTGNLMGGGACVSALKRHIAAGLAAYATATAALTVRDNLDEVRRRGVQIVDAPPDPSAVTIETGDVDLAALQGLVAPYDLSLPEKMAIAVQDHGECLTGRNRELRFRLWRDFVLGGGLLRDLAYATPPPHFTRMRAVQRSAPGAIVMDTAAAAIRGALCDPLVAARRDDGLIVLNVGNQHVLAALIRGERMYGLCEHHTVLVDRPKLQNLLRTLYDGSISDEAVRADNGHGATVHPEHQPWRRVPFVAVTGPRRAMVEGLGYHFAAPFGNMMLSGAFGLAIAACGEERLWPQS